MVFMIHLRGLTAIRGPLIIIESEILTTEQV